jgi:hypothetical protein
MDAAEAFTRAFPEDSLARRMVPLDELAGRMRTSAAMNQALSIRLAHIEGTEIYEDDPAHASFVLPPGLSKRSVRTIGGLLKLRPDATQLEALQAAYPELIKQVPLALVRCLRVLPHTRLALQVLEEPIGRAESLLFSPQQESEIRAVVEQQMSHLKPAEATVLALRYGLYGGIEQDTKTVQAQTNFPLHTVHVMSDRAIRALRKGDACAIFARVLNPSPTPEQIQQWEAEVRRARFVREFKLHTLMALRTWENQEGETLLSARLGYALNEKAGMLDNATSIRDLYLPTTKELRSDPAYQEILAGGDGLNIVEKSSIFNRLLSALYHNPRLRVRRVSQLRDPAIIGDIVESPSSYRSLSAQAATFILVAFAQQDQTPRDFHT